MFILREGLKPSLYTHPTLMSSPATKLSTWTMMLLIWNAALLAIAIFYLARIYNQHVSWDAETFAQSCIEAYEK